MKGIERLLDWVGTLRLSGLVWADEMAGELESTVDLIKREHAEDCFSMGLDYGAVSRVTADMERHVSGAEGAEDSPVARWSRELRGALTSNEAEKMKRGHADDVSMSAYDLLSQADHDAIAWVREHGGLSHVKDIYHDFRAVVERLGIEWSESELHGLMDALDRRLMPEGMEWPRYESGEPVRIGGTVADELGHAHEVTSVEIFDNGADLRWNPAEPEECVWVGRGEPVRRPSVLAADGEPLEAGQTVWLVDTGAEYWVKSGQTITADAVVIIRKTDCDCESEIVKASQLTHQRPVLDADGNRIEPAMDVWWVCEGDRRGVHAERLHVDGIDDDGEVECSPYNGGTSVVLEPSELYVNKPVLDADGVPIKEGDTVWPKYPYEEPDRQVESAEVVYVHRLGRIDIQAKYATGMSFRQQVDAKQLTHTKPEPRDSWERIEEDKGLNPFDYCKKVGHKLWTFDNAEEVKASDLVRRCKALAERERGE